MGPILGPWSQPAQYTPGIWQYAGRRECWLLEGRYCDPGPGQLLQSSVPAHIYAVCWWEGKLRTGGSFTDCDPGPGQLL